MIVDIDMLKGIVVFVGDTQQITETVGTKLWHKAFVNQHLIDRIGEP